MIIHELSLQFHCRAHGLHNDIFGVDACAHFTRQVPFHISPEDLVSQSVDNGTNKPWQDLDNDIHGKAYLLELCGQ